MQCQFKVSGPILEKQKELLLAAHCKGGCDEGFAMATCLGGDSEENFFGLRPVSMWNRRGFADFLAGECGLCVCNSVCPRLPPVFAFLV